MPALVGATLPGWRCHAFPLEDTPRSIVAWFDCVEPITLPHSPAGRYDPDYGWDGVLLAARRLGNRHQIPGCRPIGTPIPPSRTEADAEIRAIAEGFREATRRSQPNLQKGDEQPPDSAVTSLVKSPGMSWKDAAERMKRLCAAGETFTSQHKLAVQFGCSSGTINKAIHKTPCAAGLGKCQTSSHPRAQSISDVVTDRTSQAREPDPADDAAIREYLDADLTPEERAFFNGLSTENQLDFLEDPDKHRKILGRQP